MAFETGVKIDVEVTGEQKIRQAFGGVIKEVQGLSGLVGQLDKVLRAYETQQSKTAKKEQELAKTKENVNSILAKQKDILKFLTEGYTRGQAGLLEYAKSAGFTSKELKALGKVLDDQRKVMGKNPFDDSTGALKKLKKEAEDNTRVLKELQKGSGLTEASIRELIRAEEALKVSMTQAGIKGNERRRALASLRKEFKDLALAAQDSGAAIEQYNADIEQSIKDAAIAEKNGLIMMDQAVQQFKKNQEEKTRFAELESKKRIDAMMREAQKQMQIANQTSAIRSQASMVSSGVDASVASKVSSLRDQGLTDSQINARLYAEQELADAIALRSKQEQIANAITAVANTINANNVKITQDTANKEKILALAKQEKISVSQAEFIISQRALGVREEEIRANIKAADSLKQYTREVEESLRREVQAQQNGLIMMDQAVEQFRRNEEEKTRKLELETKKRIDAMMREAQKQAQIASQTQNIRSQADMVRAGVAPDVAAKVTNLRSQGLDDSQINARLYAEQELADAIAARSRQEQAAAGISKALNTINANNAKLTQDTANKEKILTLAKQEKISVSQAEFIVTQRLLGVREQEIRANLRASQALKDYEASTKKATVSLSGFGGVIRQILPTVGALGLGSVLTQTAVAFIRTADTMSLLKNRMKLVVDETQNFEQVYAGLVQTSINNRASLTDTVTLFNRLVPALKANGIEASAATTVIDSFQKTLLISGATVRETSSAMLQLSQAFAAGRLNGDEFRSISEAAPEFLRTFSKATGVAAGSLKELAADGKLTTEVLTAAMIVMNDELTKTAAGIDITFGQAVQVLGTRLSVLVDTINEATGFTKSLAEATFNVSETVRVFTDTISANKELVSSVVSVLSEVVSVLGATALAYGAIRVAIIAAAPFVSLFNVAMTAYGAAAGTAAVGASAAATATTALGTAVKGLLSSTGIGALAVILGMAGVALADYVFSSDEAAKASTNVKEKTEEETASIEKAKSILENFGMIYGSAAGAAGVYAKEADKLTQAFIEQKVSAEGLYLIKKNMIELDRANAAAELNAISRSDVITEDNKRQIKEKLAIIEQSNRLLDIMKLTEEERKRVESARASSSKANKQEEKVYEKINKQLDDLILKYQDYSKELTDIEKVENSLNVALSKKLITQEEYNKQLDKLNTAKAYKETIDLLEGYEQLAKAQNKVFDETVAQTKSYEEQVFEIEKQILSVGKNKDELLALEQAKIDDTITTIRQTQANIEGVVGQEQQVEAYEKQIKALEDLKDAKGRLAQAEKDAEFNKELEKIFDDVGKIFGEAIFNGGADSVEKLGKNIKNYFKSLVVRLVIEPQLKNISTQLMNFVSGKSVDFGSLGSSLQSLSAGLVGGSTGTALSGLLSNQEAILKGSFALAESFGASTQAAANFANAANGFAGQLAPYAGAISLAFQGNLKGAAGSALGTYIGGAVAGPIGAAIGSFLGSKIGGGGKISATAFGPEFSKPIVEQLNKQYQDLTKSLGGQALSNVSFGAGGNTGRQGQNPNFMLSASVDGKSVFSSARTAEGQYDGLFQVGEIALNEKNLADQSLRALFETLKRTDFADNIDAVIKSVNTYSDSFEKLQTALSDAQLLRTINQEFPKLGGALATLANQSIETVKSFVLLAGGFENLQNMQTSYINSIYSEEEKLALATKNLQEAFSALGLSVPASAAEFKALVEAQNLTTVEGQATYLSLLQLSGAFAEVNRTTEEATKAQKELAKQVSDGMLKISNSIRQTISKVLFDEMIPVNQLADLQSQFNLAVQTALSAEGQSLITAGEQVDKLINEVLQSATEIYASGPEYQRIKDMVLQQADLVADRLEALAPMTYQEETVALLQSISQSSAATVQALTGGSTTSTSTPVVTTNTTSTTTPAVSLPVSTGTTMVQNNIDISAIVAELQALRQDVAESGEINIKVVTEDGRVITEETLKQIKDRSKRGELVIYASGVK